MKGEDIKLMIVAVLAIVAIILATFSIMVPEDKDDEEVGEEINSPPSAQIDAGSTSAEELEVIHFDGSGSSDSDGIIIEYTWDFGDGILDSGMFSDHSYSLAGLYNVSLRVTDDRGDSDTSSITVNISEKLVIQNTPPTADIEADSTAVEIGTEIMFNGSKSSDSDGLIIEYTWDFGDGKFDSGMYSSHSYSLAGTYNITLTVTDDAGDSDSILITITVNDTEQNVPPVAHMLISASDGEPGEGIFFNGSQSTDADGEIVECIWDFGDGTKESGMYSNHIYQSDGTYNVCLTVIDDDGAEGVDYGLVVIVEPTPEVITPKGTLEFTESTQTPGLYVGSFIYLSRTVNIANVSMKIVDNSLGDWESQDPITPGYVLQVPGGVNCTFYDNNVNNKIDGGDTIRMYECSAGDQIQFIFKPTGDTIAHYTFSMPTPSGTLDFTESGSTPGLWTGYFTSLTSSVSFSDISLTIIDDSLGQSATQDPMNAGVTIQIPGGLNCTYTDNNADSKIDGGDTIMMYEVGSDDMIRFVYKPTGGIIAQYTFSITTPTGSLDFTESGTTPGLYMGSFVALSKSVYFSEVNITITDDSLGQSAYQDPLDPGVTFQVSGGLNCTYYDNNINSKIDGGDTIRMYNVESGDNIKFIYKPTGEIIAQFTFA